ncbi:MAG: PAS domain S-box protein [Pyrinomonadaceae bacterium]
MTELTHYIAEQERIGKALAQSEAQFRSAFDHAPIGMALVSPTGRFIKVNSALGKIVGRREDELLAMNFPDANSRPGRPHPNGRQFAAHT